MSESDSARPAHILPIIVLAQFMASSVWFAANAVLGDLYSLWQLPDQSISLVTSAVQFGFVVGTLCFALLSISDRYSPPSVFLVCALLGAVFNAGVFVAPEGLAPLMLLRFATGFFLAGVYPVGMKIAASWYAEGLGRALGYLLGALVLGSAFPHLLEALGAELPWRWVMACVSVVAVAGGLAVYWLVPAGPHLPGKTVFDVRVIPEVFRSRDLRRAAFGYFGHMWELYPLWAFFPVLLALHWSLQDVTLAAPTLSLLTFTAMAVGVIGCVGGGLLARRLGSPRVAFFQLACSGLCCLASPFMLATPTPIFLAFVVVWGITVAGDSPQFSSLVAAGAPRAYVGTALTLVNCIGFSITVVSLQVVEWARLVLAPEYMLWILLPGPLLGLIGMRGLLNRA